MSNAVTTLYRFNDYLVEAGKGCLWRNDELVSLTPKAFETLVVLLKHRGHVVEKDVLLSEIWADTFVEEATLAQNISTLRKALGTLEGGKQFIETIPRRGYRFVADVKEIIGDEELVIFERRVRTQITAEHEKISDEITMRADTEIQLSNAVAHKNSLTWLRNKQILLIAAVLIFCLILTGLFFSIRHFSQSGSFSSAKFKQLEISKLTSDGNVYKVAVSPDGKYLALVESRGEMQSLLVRQIDDSKIVEILPPKKQIFMGLTFASDGKQIYYAVYDKENQSTANLQGSLYRISMLGGVPQQLVSDIDSPIAISPDNRQFAFIRHYLDEKESALIISAFGEEAAEKKLAVRRILERFSAAGLSWSPDGKIIACAAYTGNQVGRQMDEFFVNAESGEQQSLTGENWSFVGQPSWLADGSGIVFPAFSQKTGGQADDIWLMSYPQGNARQVTNGISGGFGLGLTADSNILVTVKSDRLASFEVASAPDFKQSRNISQSLTEYNLNAPGFNWAPNNLILYGLTLNGNQDIWAINADGSGKHQLTNDADADYLPVSMPDGRFIVFMSDRSGRRNLWLMKSDGSEQKQLTTEGNAYSPSVAPDNQTIFYSFLDQQVSHNTLRKMTINGGKPETVTAQPTYLPQVSPDGKMIACYSPRISADGKSETPLILTILSSRDGSVIKQFDNILIQESLFPISWRGSQSITYSTNDDGVSKLWEQSIKGGDAQVLIALPNSDIFRIAWSPDNQKVVCEKGLSINDIILVKSM